jgi:hypothetical protein
VFGGQVILRRIRPRGRPLHSKNALDPDAITTIATRKLLQSENQGGKRRPPQSDASKPVESEPKSPEKPKSPKTQVLENPSS